MMTAISISLGGQPSPRTESLRAPPLKHSRTTYCSTVAKRVVVLGVPLAAIEVDDAVAQGYPRRTRAGSIRAGYVALHETPNTGTLCWGRSHLTDSFLVLSASASCAGTPWLRARRVSATYTNCCSHVFVCVGGGVQEKLGFYLKQNAAAHPEEASDFRMRPSAAQIDRSRAGTSRSVSRTDRA